MAEKNIEELLGSGKPGEQQELNPLEATPDGGNPEENPLEKMDKISKAKPDKKKEDTGLDEETVLDMLKTGENSNGMFIPDKEEEHEEEDEGAKVKLGKQVTPSKKYEKQFKNDLLKNPDQYKVMTPKGEMTVAEAIKQGYNPITKRFEKNHGQKAIKEKHLSQLNEADRTALEKFTAPENAQVAPADAEKYGLQPNSPMIRSPEASNPSPAMNPMMAALGGGGASPMEPAQAPVPEVPGLGAPQPEAGAQNPADIMSLLGGN